MAYTITLTVQKIDGGSKSSQLTDNEIPDAKMASVVEFAWDDRATEAEEEAGGPGDDLNLDLDILVRVVRAQLHAWFAQKAGRKARHLSEPLE